MRATLEFCVGLLELEELLFLLGGAIRQGSKGINLEDVQADQKSGEKEPYGKCYFFPHNFIATRSLADRALGFFFISVSVGTIGFLVKGLSEGSCLKKVFTIRSSNE